MSARNLPRPRLHKGQTYEAVLAEPYICRDGRETHLIVWQSHCATCGEPFTFKTAIYATRFEPNRRCQKHKRPGHRVKEAS